MSRKIYYWKLRESELQLGERTLIMGILNITPDSFSDGGRYLDPDRAYARAIELEEQGADIIDIGAESTKPGSRRISADEEWQRLVPVLKRLRGNIAIPISIDTYKAEVAERAMEYGVQIINDPSGLTFDPEIVKIAANANAGLILSHMRGTPETWAKLPPMQDPAAAVVKDLDATVNRARRGGVDRARIVVDPGLGFGKRKEQNSEIIANLRQFTSLDCPILIGPSRKHFLAQDTETGTLFATAAAVTVSVMLGAHMVRVHDVKEMLPAIRLADEIAAMPDIAARHAEAAAERAAERTAAKAARLGSPMHIEEPRPRAARPPLARVVRPEPVEVPVVKDAEAAVESEGTEPVEAVMTSPVFASDEALVAQAEVSESAEVGTEAWGEPSEQQGEEVMRPAAAASKPYERKPYERPGGERPYRRDAGEQQGTGERTGWGPPRRRDAESGPPSRGAGRFEPRGPRPPYGGGDGDRRSGPPPRAGGGYPERRFEGKPAGRPYPNDRPRGDDRDGPPRPPRDGDDRPQRRSFGPPRDGGFRSGPPRSGPPRGDRDDYRPRSGPPSGDRPYGGPPSGGGFRSGPPRSGPPSGGGFRSGPPSGGGFRSGPPRSGPPSGGGFRSGPPSGGGFRSGPPRSGPPSAGGFRSGPPSAGGFRSGPPSGGGFRSGPPRSGPPRDFGEDRGPRGDRPSYDKPRSSGKPPFGKPPFGKPPGGSRPFNKSDGDRPSSGKPGPHGRPFRKRP